MPRAIGHTIVLSKFNNIKRAKFFTCKRVDERMDYVRSLESNIKLSGI